MKRSGPRSAFSAGPGLVLDAVLIASGTFAVLWHPRPEWVEARFSNGYYAHWEHFWASVTPRVPFSLGDAVIVAGGCAALWIVIHNGARIRRLHSWWPLLRMAIGLAAIAGLYGAWFYAGWGWGYDRAPLQTRTAYDAKRITPAAIAALRARAIMEMNRLAPIAHRQHAGARGGGDIASLRAAWQPVVERLGDMWTPAVHRAKPTLAGWFMDRNGTSGFTNPFTLETQLAPDLLWFERPFDQAHEWSHVAGFNREDEANYIAALTCLRSRDARARYSGWLEVFLYLPPLPHYAQRTFVPVVWADFSAMRERNARYVNHMFSLFSWRLYNRYLKTNHIAAGVANYDAVTQLLAGIPLDARGLPRVR